VRSAAAAAGGCCSAAFAGRPMKYAVQDEQETKPDQRSKKILGDASIGRYRSKALTFARVPGASARSL
jgi:hypothetical protein